MGRPDTCAVAHLGALQERLVVRFEYYLSGLRVPRRMTKLIWSVFRTYQLATDPNLLTAEARAPFLPAPTPPPETSVLRYGRATLIRCCLFKVREIRKLREREREGGGRGTVSPRVLTLRFGHQSQRW